MPLNRICRLALTGCAALALWLLTHPLPAEAQAPRGARELGIDITEGARGGFEAAFEMAQDAGMDQTSLSVAWDEIETAPGVYASELLPVADFFFSSHRLPIALTLSVIDTTNLRLPADLAGRQLDDPVVIARFRGLLDFVFAATPNLELSSLAIGNEVDIFLGTDAGAWARYEAFFRTTAGHARALAPGVPVGVTNTWVGATGPASAFVQSINQHADEVLLTYYPLDDSFRVRPPSSVAADFDAAVALFPGKRITFLEAGYPSGALNGSSEELQRQFVAAVFDAWDRHRDQIEKVSLTWLTDISQQAVDFFVDYYGVGDPRFAEYLKTLGLVRENGEPKPAFLELKEQAAARGWWTDVGGGPTSCVPDAETLCLEDGRWRVTVDWLDHQRNTGRGSLVDVASRDSGLWWFFRPDNWEMLVKVLDGCAINGHHWVFFAATTDVAYTLTLVDTTIGAAESYTNLLGVPSPAITDTRAFATCDEGATRSR